MSSMHAVLGRILGGDTRESAVAYPRVRLVRVDDRRGASVRPPSGPTDDSSSGWQPVVLVLIVGVRGRLVLSSGRGVAFVLLVYM